MKNYNVCIATVTFNRKDYLLKLLDALSKQSTKIDTIYILDNHSLDGTKDRLLQDGIIIKAEDGSYVNVWRGVNIKYYYNARNTGGSGGFEKIFKIASSYEHDYLWAMDDDVLPEQNCLEELLRAMDDKHRVVVPCRTDDKFRDYSVTRYNLSNPFIFRQCNRIKTSYSDEISEDYSDTYFFPLEGPLFDMEIVRKVGTPDARYFIMYDDSDYARRCLAYTKLRYAKPAILHKQIIPSSENVYSWKIYYNYRNCFLYDMKYGENIGVRKLRPFIIASATYMMKRFVRKDRLTADVVKVAYKDAVSGRVGKTVEPGKLEAYLEKHR